MREPIPRYEMTWALFALALINLGVYVLWHTWGYENYAFMRQNFLVSPESVLNGRFWTLFTTMFSHTDPMHLLFNLLALWVFGSSVERVIGPLKFALLYLLGGLAGSIGFVAWGTLRGDPSAALGASGAVMAIAAVYGCWFPKRTLMINFIIPLPAWLAVVLFIGMDVFGMFGVGVEGGQPIANAAHLGGAFFGLAVGLPRFLRTLRS